MKRNKHRDNTPATNHIITHIISVNIQQAQAVAIKRQKQKYDTNTML